MYCSVIIPLYNKAAFIKGTLESVLRQSHQNFEVIVVDDGSTDNSLAVVQSINDARIRWFSRANGGVSRARNYGIDVAKGDLICFLDADDWYAPDYLATIVEMAKSNPVYEVFATGYLRVPDGEAPNFFCEAELLKARIVVDNMFARMIGRPQLFHICSVAVRRSVASTMQPCFPEGENMGEDLDFLFRLACRGPIISCPAALVGYRTQVPSSLCTINPISDLLPVFQRLEKLGSCGDISLELRSSILELVADMRITIARRALMVGDWRKAARELMRGRRGVSRHRWWLTLLMCLIPIPSLALHWESWRRRGLERTRSAVQK